MAGPASETGTPRNPLEDSTMTVHNRAAQIPEMGRVEQSPLRQFPWRFERTEGTSPRAEESHMRAVREECQAIARRARDAFAVACDSSDPDNAEASFFSAKDRLQELWAMAPYRDRPFRDLLGLLDAAIKKVDLTAFSQAQRDV